VRPQQRRANPAQLAQEHAGAACRKGVTDEWQIVVTVEETPPDGPLDLLLRREQADAVFRLAAAGQQAERAGCREG